MFFFCFVFFLQSILKCRVEADMVSVDEYPAPFTVMLLETCLVAL